MQSDRGDILSTDARDHGVTAFQLAVEDQLSQKHGPDPVAGAIGTDVDGVLDGKTISIAGAELRCVTKTHNLALELRNQVRQTAIENGLAAAAHLSLIRSDGFERGCAGGDEVSIDRSDIRNVRGHCRTNQAFGRAGIVIRRVGDGK